jgi:diguanylate cyclase (GGDEF)-like protein
VDKSVSFADYLKLVSYASSRYDKLAYSLPKEDFEVRMLMNDFKSTLGQEMFERFMSTDLSQVNICLRTHISSSRDFLRLKREISGFLGKTLPAPFTFQVTGLGIVISKSSDLLSKGQVKSLSITILLIFVIMFSLFMTRKVALITLLPNLFPVVVNFGVMGWMGIELSMATSLIASIAIGLAVDDTIHYMVQYNLEFKKDLDRERALTETIQRVGKPIMLTTLTLGIGFSILIFSHFKPTAVFGLLMVVTMFSALVGDLILLPTLMTRVELVTIWDLIRFKMGKDPRQGVSLFRGLSRLEIYFILMAGSLKNYRKGEVIFKRGDPGDSLFAVISGELQVVEALGDLEKYGTGGARKRLGTLRRGDMVGELGLARSHRRAATVVAAESSELLRINYDMIKRLYWIFPPTAQKFFFNLMSSLGNKMEYYMKSFSEVTTVDSVTGLHNCDHFMPTLQKEVTRSHRYGLDLSVGIIHMDLFREFSQAHGIGKAEEVLAQAGKILHGEMPEDDLLARYGQQKFAFILIHSPMAAARKTCTQLRRKLEKHNFGSGLAPVYITVSMGIASLEEGETAKDLIERALQEVRQAVTERRDSFPFGW